MAKLIIIYPKDPSTEFLGEIVLYLQKRYGELACLIQPPFESGFQILEKEIEEQYKEGDIILFLGHGSRSAVFGEVYNGGRKSELLNIVTGEQLLSDRQIVLFSCESREFIRGIGERPNKYLGFGDIPTDWKEVQNQREFRDPNYLHGITEVAMNFYRVSMTDSLLNGLKMCEVNRSFIRNLYLAMRLELNQLLDDLPSITEFELDVRIAVFNLIQQTKWSMSIKD